MRKIIFLDIDGVLNNEKYDRKMSGKEDFDICSSTGWCPLSVLLLKELLHNIPELELVIHSTWAHCRDIDLKKEFDRVGIFLEKINGGLQIAVEGARFSENNRKAACIKHFRHENNIGNDEYIILDDDYMEDNKHQIRTTWTYGLERWHKEEILKRFNN